MRRARAIRLQVLVTTPATGWKLHPEAFPSGLTLIFGFKSLRLGSGAPPIRSGVIGMILGLVSAALGPLFWVHNV